MSSAYIKNFYKEGDRPVVLGIIDDFENGDSLKHYKKRFVSDNTYSQNLIDWKRRYVTSNYMSHVIENYLGYIQVLKDLDKDYMRNKNGSINEEKESLLNEFYRLNSWNSLFKVIASARKKHGDVYIYWYLIDGEDGKQYPKMEFIDSKFVEAKQDQDGLIYAYVYERSVKYDVEQANGEFAEMSKTVKWIFRKGGIDIYEDGIYKETAKNRKIFEDDIPIIHLQFMKEPHSPYSKIPAESFIDLCLELDRIESDIALINTLMGAPQLIVIDGKVDTKNSAFGPNAIFYVDSILTDSINGVSKQTQVKQLEIGNDLKSLYDERITKIEILYDKANLISPSIYEKLSTTDSSKVWDSVRKDLEQEIKDFYEEVIDKFQVIFKVLFSVNEIDLPKNNKSVSFELPEYIIEKTIYDKYLLKAQKMNVGELSIQENLRNEGYSESDIKRLIKEMNEEFLEKNKDISISKEAKAKGTSSSASSSSDTKLETAGVDNSLKKVNIQTK